MPKCGALGGVALQLGQDTSKPVVPVGYKGDAAATAGKAAHASTATIAATRIASGLILLVGRFTCLPSSRITTNIFHSNGLAAQLTVTAQGVGKMDGVVVHDDDRRPVGARVGACYPTNQ